MVIVAAAPNGIDHFLEVCQWLLNLLDSNSLQSDFKNSPLELSASLPCSKPLAFCYFCLLGQAADSAVPKERSLGILSCQVCDLS